MKESIDQPLAYVHWLDANYSEGEQEVDKIDWKCELHYVGWLVREDAEAITLSLELPHEGRTRNTFTILKANILEMRLVEFRKAFPKPRKRTSSKVVNVPLERGNVEVTIGG